MHLFLDFGIYSHLFNIVLMFIFFALVWVKIPLHLAGKHQKSRNAVKKKISKDTEEHNSVSDRIGRCISALDNRIHQITTKGNG